MRPFPFFCLLSVSALTFPLASIAQTLAAAPVGAVVAPMAVAALMGGACLWLAFLAALMAAVVGGEFWR